MVPLTWLVRLVVYGLAVFRLARLISLEEGPGNIFGWLRQKAGVETITEEQGEWVTVVGTPVPFAEYQVAESILARLITCPLCVSVWLALPAVASLWLDWLFGDIVATWLAIASITVILHRDD